MKTPTLSLKLCTFFATLLFTAAQSPADVLIYKGTIRVVADVTSPLPKVVPIFEVIDLKASTIGSVSPLVVDGQKVLLVSPPSQFRITQAPLAKGQTATTISLVLTSGGSNDSFSNIAFHNRGKNTTLRTSSQIGAVVVFPRIITGNAAQDQASTGDGLFVEQRVLLGYQEARTKAANDAKQTTQQVLDALALEFKAKGFEPPTP
jgi:hypothetical protein